MTANDFVVNIAARAVSALRQTAERLDDFQSAVPAETIAADRIRKARTHVALARKYLDPNEEL